MSTAGLTLEETLEDFSAHLQLIDQVAEILQERDEDSKRLSEYSDIISQQRDTIERMSMQDQFCPVNGTINMAMIKLPVFKIAPTKNCFCKAIQNQCPVKPTAFENLRKVQMDLAKQIQYLAIDLQRNNLIFNGIPEDLEASLYMTVQQILYHMMGNSSSQFPACDVTVSRIGTAQASQYLSCPRPVRVKFFDISERNAIWNASSKLTGAQVSIMEDLSLLTRVEKAKKRRERVEEGMKQENAKFQEKAKFQENTKLQENGKEALLLSLNNTGHLVESTTGY